MNAFLVLLLLQVSTGAFDVRVAKFDSMAECQIAKAKIEVPAMPDVSYWLECTAFRATDETPA